MSNPESDDGAVADDFAKLQEALIVLSGHLPLFSDDKRKVARAAEHLALRDQAFDALDRLADDLCIPHVPRRLRA